METIVTHIEYLLRHHACVIVPGIGAFIVSSHPARFSEDGLTLFPPRREICFNSALSHDDGVLAGSIARRQGISYEEARSHMLRLTAAMARCLETDGEITIGKIGCLIRHADSTIEFTPRHSVAEYPALVGMPTLRMESFKKVAATSADNSYSLYNIEEYDISTQKSEEGEERKRNSEYWYIAINKRIAKAVASVVLIATVCIGLCIPASDKQSEPAQANVLPVKEIIEESHKAIEKDSISAISDSSEKENAEIAEANKGYHLIVASFKNESEAKKFISMHDNGSYPLEIERTKTMWMVSAASSAEKSELISLSRSSDFRSQFEGSWVWKER